MSDNSKNTGATVPDKTHFWGVVILIVVALGIIADTIKADSKEFYSDIIRLDNVATRIHQHYVEEVISEDLIDNAIKGMLEILDPHTSFFKKKDYEELRIHTEGKFGGLGIQISIREKVLTVMTPISGTPASRAGIQSGDRIIKIDDESTYGITIDGAVAKLRGEPGSEVFITVQRKGEIKPLDFTITREIIVIKSVPFWGVLEQNIGYVKLVTFSQEAGDEVEKAIKELLKQNIKGLIFDLRHNPGGLLPQAIEVSEKFLDRKSLVVSTRGRLLNQNTDYQAKSNPVLPKDMPLVVLVSSSSASASEIVAGAIQDWDRGVILGDTTYGKGSVQSILPLDPEHHLKLTTAFYYTPSGRCINKAENGIRGNGVEGEDADKDVEKSDDIADSTNADQVAADTIDIPEYKTKSGRVVYGGGGIIPDTIVDPYIPELAIRSLFYKDTFFKFANVKYPKLQSEKIVVDSAFKITGDILKEFYLFLDSIDFEYKNYTESKFDEFRSLAGLVEDTVDKKDNESSDVDGKPEWTPEELEELKIVSAKIEKILKKEGERELKKCEDVIIRFIREALLIRSMGQDNDIVYRTKLSNDKQTSIAVGILSDKKIYENLLKPVKLAKNK